MEIKLPCGSICLIDDEDSVKVSGFRWWGTTNSYSKTKYAGAHLPNRGGQIKMHRLILDAKKGVTVDHINGNGLDNRRQNLRLALSQQNSANQRKREGTSSKFKGVSLDRGKWFAKITVKYEQIYLGRFGLEEDAARAYDIAAKSHYGEFARTNF